MNRTYGRNLTLALAACAALCALCALLAGRYELERRHNWELQDHIGTLNIKLDLVRQSEEAAASAEVLAERTVYKKAAEDLSRRLGRYEADNPGGGEYGQYREYVTVATVPPGKPLGRALDALGRAGVDCTFDGRPRGYDLAVRPADTGVAWRALRRDAVEHGYPVSARYEPSSQANEKGGQEGLSR